MFAFEFSAHNARVSCQYEDIPTPLEEQEEVACLTKLHWLHFWNDSKEATKV